MMISIEPRRVRQALCFAAFLLLAAAAHYLTLQAGYRTLEKYLPDWTAIGLARLTIGALAAFFLVAALRPSDRTLSARGDIPSWLLVALWTASFVLLWSAVLAVLTWPDRLAGHVREGGFLSIQTEVAFALALIFLLVAARRARHLDNARLAGLSAAQVILAIAAVAFIVVMEEASWGQHWIGWGTPPVFDGNIQNETNIHNFYTYRFEMAYYSAAVAAFVLLPYAWPDQPPRFLRGASLFVPPPLFAVALLPLCGFMFYNWNWVFFGIWFFAAIFIALDLARRSTGIAAVAALVMGASLIGAQAIFLTWGITLDWGHELTEIREFAIAVAVLGYAVMIWSRTATSPQRVAQADLDRVLSAQAPRRPV